MIFKLHTYRTLLVYFYGHFNVYKSIYNSKFHICLSFLALNCTGHLLQCLHIFKYFDTHQNNDFAFDPMHHNLENNDVVKDRIQVMQNIYVGS